MRSGGKSDSRRPAERASVAALLAVLALLVQALLPAAAMAAQAGSPGQTLVICTANGVETIRLSASGEPEKGFAGLPCQDCLAPATTALPPPQLAALPVAYTVARVSHAETVRPWAAPARAPPRPPGQAPPAPNA